MVKSKQEVIKQEVINVAMGIFGLHNLTPYQRAALTVLLENYKGVSLDEYEKLKTDYKVLKKLYENDEKLKKAKSPATFHKKCFKERFFSYGT